MKILCILGSPRVNGHSTGLARHFVKTAESLGAETTTYILNELSYRGCQGCYACKEKFETCVLGDGLKQVLDQLHEVDVVVAATPIYAGEVSGQFKCFIDRTFSCMKPDYTSNPRPSRLSQGKKFVFIVTHGNPSEDMYAPLTDRYEGWFRNALGFKETHSIRGCGLTPVVPVSDALLKRVEELAKAVVK